jgi:hypothetical protein
MSVEFDPYHEWLGIPPAEQPPTHYRLLGITAFEEKASVIQNATDRLMAHLRTFQTGKHSAESQRLLNEVAKARVCLLNPEKKRAYDQSLREQLASAKGEERSSSGGLDRELMATIRAHVPNKAGGAAVLPIAERMVPKTPARKRTGPQRHSKGPSIIGIIVSGLAAVLVVLGIYAILHRNSGPNPPSIAESPPAKATGDVSLPANPNPNPKSTSETPRQKPPNPDPKPTSEPPRRGPPVQSPEPGDGTPRSAPQPVETTIVVDRNTNERASADFRFPRIPSPQASAASQALITVVDGRLDRIAGRHELNDQTLPTHMDDPSHNLFFNQRTSRGRLLIDLRRAIQIKQINTYSWHVGSRGPQVYKLYASDGSGTNFDSSPKAPVDPTRVGWRLLASVDTRPADGDQGGQYGVSISAPTGKIGTYRYLLFDMAQTETDDLFGNTFYSRIDVIDANQEPPAAEISEIAWSSWKELFDGKTLNGWKQLTNGMFAFKGLGSVTVENGELEMAHEKWFVGIAPTAILPSTNYEVQLEATRISGAMLLNVRFPVGSESCDLTVANGVVGISPVDGLSPARNGTLRRVAIETGRR